MASTHLTHTDIEHMAQLAQLTLTKEEKDEYKTQLEETISYIDNLTELDTQNTKPSHSVIDTRNIFFEDGTKNERTLTQKEALSQAAQTKDQQFSVRRIL